MLESLQQRSGSSCEICGATESLQIMGVGPGEESVDRAAMVCEICGSQITGELTDPKHWFCLRESIWSEVAAVQVLSWRVLHRLQTETWAVETLEGAYLDEEVLEWARAGLEEAGEQGPEVVDSNGSVLHDGDSVSLIKDLDVKGASFTAKRGTLVKNIRLGDDPTHVEGRVNKTAIMLKTCFLKRVG
jgi:protein PhnA